MQRRWSIGGQLRALSPLLPAVYALTLLLLFVVAVQDVVPPAFLVRDPASVASYPFFIGLVSNVGVLLWWACAAVCLFTAVALRGRNDVAYLASAGMLTALLTVDDFFGLHDEVLPRYLHISERMALGIYAALTLAFLMGFWKVILRTDFLPLLLALGFFAASAIVDQGFFSQGLNYLLDDGLKLLGIVSWTAYFMLTCLQALTGGSLLPQVYLPARLHQPGAHPTLQEQHLSVLSRPAHLRDEGVRPGT